jgi:hypothetical protein
MNRLVVFACLAVLAAWPAPGRATPWAGASDQSGSDQKQGKAKTEQKAKGASLTGCIDEKEGRYVLVDERTLNPVANLEADGFETEGFAKHVGHKVTVRGTSNPGGEVPVFKVRSIETVSEVCAPQREQGKR